VAKVPLLRLEIVKRSGDMKGFVVLQRRWVVERIFSWFGRNRRLAKDFENLAETLATFVTLAPITLAIRRLARSRSYTQQTAGRQRTITNVGKLDCERTFARESGNDEVAPKIGIGGHLAMPPLPHHRAYGSRTRRFDWVKLGQEHEVEGDRASRSSGCAGPVGPPGVRTCARTPSANRRRPLH
jgi:hypothetical protein